MDIYKKIIESLPTSDGYSNLGDYSISHVLGFSAMFGITANHWKGVQSVEVKFYDQFHHPIPPPERGQNTPIAYWNENYPTFENQLKQHFCSCHYKIAPGPDHSKLLYAATEEWAVATIVRMVKQKVSSMTLLGMSHMAQQLDTRDILIAETDKESSGIKYAMCLKDGNGLDRLVLVDLCQRKGHNMQEVRVDSWSAEPFDWIHDDLGCQPDWLTELCGDTASTVIDAIRARAESELMDIKTAPTKGLFDRPKLPTQATS